MRRAGKGIDPRAMIYDMSGDPVTYGTQRCELVNAKLGELLKKAALERRELAVPASSLSHPLP